jgi:hypothetical protein
MTNVVHVNTTISCPHGGSAMLNPADQRVTLTGQLAGSLAGRWTVVGCAFTLPNGTPQPCVMISWTTTAARVKISGSPAVTQVSQGLCLSAAQIPQGPPIVSATQQRAKGI